MIKRDYYLNQIIKREWDGNIKVITGIRRCGKSVLLFELFKDYLISKGIEQAQIIEIKLDKIDYIKYRNPFYLYKQINKTITLNTELLKKEIALIDYVIIHELSHIIHFTHSKSFWNLVGKYCSNYKEIRKEMKD